MQHKYAASRQQLADLKQEIFEAVYAQIPPHEQDQVNEMIKTLARFPKIGDASAREVLVSAILLFELEQRAAPGARRIGDVWPAITRLMRKKANG